MSNRNLLHFWVISFIAAVWIFSYLANIAVIQKISPAQLKEAIQQDRVAEIVFVPETYEISGSFKPSGEGKQGLQFKVRAVGTVHLEEIRKLAEEKNVAYRVSNPPSSWLSAILSSLLIFGGFIFLFSYLSRKQSEQMGGKNGGPFGFGKSKARQYVRNGDRKTFADVAGCDESKEELQEIVQFLKDPSEFTRLGARVPKGVLLYGDPGTGKTLLARAVAGEANVNFLFSSGSEFVEMFVGVGASRVRNLFENARKLTPCVVFIDEIDAVGRARSGAGVGNAHDEREQTIDALLHELDGFIPNQGIIVIAATNRPDILDQALIRPGRFDRQVNVPRPDLRGREMILKVHVKNIKLSTAVDLLIIAKDTAGMVGADLENVVNEAALIAARKKRLAVEQSDFSEAVDRVSMGPMKKSAKLSEREKRTTAYHESGHTLVAMLSEHADPVHKVTIIPRGPALGFTKQLPEDDRHIHTKKQLEAMVAVCLGGRAAEELVLKDITTGAANDLSKATTILRKMVYELGMYEKELGLAVFQEKFDFWGNPAGVDASQKTKEVLEALVQKELKRIYECAMNHLVGNRGKLDALAEALLEKETLDAKEIQEILNSA